jgi:hypothetical protein
MKSHQYDGDPDNKITECIQQLQMHQLLSVPATSSGENEKGGKWINLRILSELLEINLFLTIWANVFLS